MRFALPVQERDELSPLSKAGAGEFYCGLLEPEWAARWGGHDSISRRQGRANFSDRGELASAALTAKQLGKPIWLTLNGRYTEPQMGYVTELARWWDESGGTGVILREVELLSRLRGAGFSGRICVSLLAAAANVETLSFFYGLGADRTVLPRFVTPQEAGELARGCPNMELEAMVMDDGCPFIDGYCRSYHGVGYALRDDGAAAEDSVYTCDTEACGHHLCRELGLAGVPPCAACSLKDLEKNGVAVGKFGGRGSKTAEKLKKLDFMTRAAALDGREEMAALHKALLGSCRCYYPVGKPEGGAP